MKNTENVALADYRGLSDELIKNLLSDHVLYDGTWWLNAFKRFLRKENPWDVRLWDEWKIISYGGDNATPKKLKYACKKNGFNVLNGYALYVLKNLKTSESKGQRSAGLIVAPLKMLGFERPATISEVNERIKKLGFFLFTEELVFNLFSQVENKHEYINIAMDPIKMPDEQEIYFALIRNGLTACGAKDQLPVGYNVVFVKHFYTIEPLEALE